MKQINQIGKNWLVYFPINYRNFIIKIAAVVVCIFILFSPLNQVKSQTTTVDPQTAALLQATLDSMITDYNLKGLSATVIIPGKGTWKGVSGISHDLVAIDTAMVFGFASITYTFTAAAILLLQEDGLLSISDSLHEFLPTYNNIDPNVTIKQLLQHYSGIYPYTSNVNWYNAVKNNPSQAMTPQFVLNNYVYPPFTAPGTSFQYSSTNFLLLGLIIEQVSGQSYTSFIRQRLLDPLQLTSLFVREHEPATGVMPHNWYQENPVTPVLDIHTMPLTAVLGTSPEAALFGNAYDLARWGQLLFTGQVLHDTSLQLMTQFKPINVGSMSGYGLGLMRNGAASTQAWGHGGNIFGFSSSLLFSPDDSIVVGILANKTSSGFPIAFPLLATARQLLVSGVTGEAVGLSNTLDCFPNPAQWNGNIKYTLQQAQQVKITLQNSLGQTVQTLLNQHQQAGEHTMTVDISALPSGIYFCSLQIGNNKLVQRWVLIQ